MFDEPKKSEQKKKEQYLCPETGAHFKFEVIYDKLNPIERKQQNLETKLAMQKIYKDMFQQKSQEKPLKQKIMLPHVTHSEFLRTEHSEQEVKQKKRQISVYKLGDIVLNDPEVNGVKSQLSCRHNKLLGK